MASDSDALSYLSDASGASDDNCSLFSKSPSEEGHERWRASEPPEEIFGDGEWAFLIIGEEVDCNGQILYEVRWDNWYREDGTNTTWQTDDTIPHAHWTVTQKNLRRQMATKSLEIDVLNTTDMHNTETYLRSQAFEEKLKQASTKPQDPFAEMAKLLGKHQVHVQAPLPTRMPSSSQVTRGTEGSSSSSFPSRASQRATTRQQTENSMASSSTIRGSSRSSVTLHSENLDSFSVLPSASSHPSSSSISSKASLKNTHAKFLDPPSAAKITAKGKHKQVFPPENLDSKNRARAPSERSHPSSHSHLPQNAPFGAKGKGKRVAPPSDNEESNNSLAPIHRKTPSQRPYVLLPARKRSTRIFKSESPISVPPSPPPLPSPVRIGPPAKTPQKIVRHDTPAVRRRKLQEAWTNYAKRAGAASIFFVNELDGEAVPELDPSFRYLESAYEFGPGIEKPPNEFLISCSCDFCFEAKDCDCQVASDLVDANGTPFFPYTPYGLFTFSAPKGMEIIECNKFCKCSLDQCVNRVSQLPRDIPIEIFKTRTRGWGVRPTRDVQRGKVLGVYTGLVVRREDADVIPAELSAYRFDLDGDEIEGHEPNHDAFSVDSRVHGNWTRFINHSCSPNLQIYLVVHDTPPNTGLPYIPFVASEDIPAYTELTFDYDPKAAEKQAMLQAKGKGKGKGKGKVSMIIPEGAKPCRCDSAECRGFLTY